MLLGAERSNLLVRRRQLRRCQRGCCSLARAILLCKTQACFAGGRGGVHPMMRHLTDAAPQEGERAFRSGALPGSEQPETAAERGMRGAAEREMGDLTEAGDAPFGGEVAVDSQVCCAAVFKAFE